VSVLEERICCWRKIEKLSSYKEIFWDLILIHNFARVNLNPKAYFIFDTALKLKWYWSEANVFINRVYGRYIV